MRTHHITCHSNRSNDVFNPERVFIGIQLQFSRRKILYRHSTTGKFGHDNRLFYLFLQRRYVFVMNDVSYKDIPAVFF